MDCHIIIVILGVFGLLLCCIASGEHDKKSHKHVHRSKEHKKVSSHSHHKSYENNEPKLHKKEEMLGQDMMRLNDAEFKLQSLVSPEFHQGSKAIHQGKSFGGMEVNTLSPEQVDFVQSTSQWPKFSSPDAKKDVSKTFYPEDPVLFPSEQQRQKSFHNNNNNWITMGSNSFKDLSGSQFDMPTGNMEGMSNMGGVSNMGGMGNMGSMGGINNMVSMASNTFQEQPQQKANTMQFDAKPGYTTTGDAPIDDKMPNFSDMGGIQVEAKSPMSYRGSSKNQMSALLNEGIMNPRGKPIGILGNILKASQEMPSGKPSARSGTWIRSHILERSHKSITHTHKRSPILKRLFKEHKDKSKKQK